MVQFRSITPLVPAGPDLAQALAFYTDQMGFTVEWQGGDMAGVRRGAVSLNLVRNSNATWAENASASIGVTDLDGLYAEYRQIPAQVGLLEVKAWGRREFHLILASGVCLQFFEAQASD